MEKKKLPQKSRLIFPRAPAAPPPSPIPTGKGSRSAADQILSEYIDTSIQIPELRLPRQVQVHQFKPGEISYESLQLREKDSVRGLVRSIRELGVFKIIDHGISTEELRIALGNSERIFGLTVECCTRYGDHEKLVWRGDDNQIMEEAGAVIGEQKLQILRQKVENVARELEGIAEELGEIIAQRVGKEFVELGESTLSIYRYHRANIIDRTSSSVVGDTTQNSGPYAFTLHLLLEPTELCLQDLSFVTTPDTIVVTMGKELEEWSLGEFKCASAEGKLLLKPLFLHTNRPSFSIEQKWSVSNPINGVGEWNKELRNAVGESNKIISLSDQILILLLLAFLYYSFSYIFS